MNDNSRNHLETTFEQKADFDVFPEPWLADQTSVPGIREMFEMIGGQSQHFLEQSVWGMRSNGGLESNHLVTDNEQPVE